MTTPDIGRCKRVANKEGIIRFTLVLAVLNQTAGEFEEFVVFCIFCLTAMTLLPTLLFIIHAVMNY